MKLLKKKGLSTLLIICISLVLVLSGCSSSSTSTGEGQSSEGESKEKYTLKAYHAFISNAPTVSYYKGFLEDLEKKSDGAIEIQMVGGPESIAPSEALQAARNGVIDIAYMGGSYYPEIGSLLSIYIYPGSTSEIYRDSGALDIMDEMLNEKYGLRFLTSFGGGDSWITISNKPIEEGTYANLKVRSSAFLNEAILALDGTPVQTPSSDRYSSLERGIVDACVVPAQEAIVENLHEPAEYAIIPGIASLQNEIWMNSAAFDGLPENLQQLVIETAKEWEIKANQDITKETEETIKELEELMTVIRLSDEEAEKFQKTTVDSLWKEMEATDPEGVAKLRPILEEKWEEISK